MYLCVIIKHARFYQCVCCFEVGALIQRSFTLRPLGPGEGVMKFLLVLFLVGSDPDSCQTQTLAAVDSVDRVAVQPLRVQDPRLLLDVNATVASADSVRLPVIPALSGCKAPRRLGAAREDLDPVGSYHK